MKTMEVLNKVGSDDVIAMLCSSLWYGAVTIEGNIIRIGINTQSCQGIISGVSGTMTFLSNPLEFNSLPTESAGVSFCLKDLAIAKTITGDRRFGDFLKFVAAHELGHAVDFSRRRQNGEVLTATHIADESFADLYAMQVLGLTKESYCEMLQVIEDTMLNIFRERVFETGKGLFHRGLVAMVTYFFHKTFRSRKDTTLGRMDERVVRTNETVKMEIENISNFIIGQMG